MATSSDCDGGCRAFCAHSLTICCRRTSRTIGGYGRAILEMEPRILAIADELAKDLFRDGSPADLVDRYARQLPLWVICELLGLPLADRPKFTAWAHSFTRFTGAIGFLSV